MLVILQSSQPGHAKLIETPGTMISVYIHPLRGLIRFERYFNRKLEGVVILQIGAFSSGLPQSMKELIGQARAIEFNVTIYSQLV
jgi:hypothetical protein